jgi:hypothetical protein
VRKVRDVARAAGRAVRRPPRLSIYRPPHLLFFLLVTPSHEQRQRHVLLALLLALLEPREQRVKIRLFT